MRMEYSPARAAKLKTWKRNRDHTDGADAVRSCARTYVPQRSNLGDTPEAATAAYNAILSTTEYFAMAARTLQSFVGLIFRKDAIFDGRDQFPEAISSDGRNADEFARACVHEYFVSNDGGVFVDTPNTPAGATIAEAQALQLYPYLSLYPAEAIRELRYQTIRGRKRLVYVRLVEDEDHGRELSLVNEQYRATIWVKIDTKWFSETITPQVGGEPLSDIPFISLSDGDTGATMDDLCDTNVTHFANSFALSQVLAWVSAPVIFLSGVKQAVELKLVPGAFWRAEDASAKAEFVEYSGDGVPALERKLDSLEQHGSMIGSRMLLQEKSVSEADGTVARRQAGENSILGSKARHVSGRLTKAIRLQAAMMGIDPTKVRYTLNTHFVPAIADPALMAEWKEAKGVGLLPLEVYFENMQKADQIDESWDFETYANAIDQEKGAEGAGTFAPPVIPPEGEQAE